MEYSKGALVPLERDPATSGGKESIWLPSQIEQADVASLTLPDRILRKHPRRQIKLLARNIVRFGFIFPITIDNDGKPITGFARIAAARELGMATIPAIRIQHLTEPEARALALADNKLTELSTWDRDALAIEMQDLLELKLEPLDFGFVTAEIDLLIQAKVPKPLNRALNDCPVADRSQPAITQPGDIWSCGFHHVGCCDSRETSLVAVLMAGRQAAMTFTDPPYNVKIDGHVSGAGAIKHAEFAMASGEMSDSEFVAFLADSLNVARSVTAPGGLIYVCMDWAHLEHLFQARQATGLGHFNHCIWAKTNAGMGSFYRSQTEHVVVFKVPGGTHTNNIELGRYGRNRSNLWTYEGANSINRERRNELGMHPTVKNCEMVADAILDCTNREDIVFDGFLGSGTTLIAAEHVDRICHGVEIDPYYVDVILRRWQEFTSEPARLVSTGEVSPTS